MPVQNGKFQNLLYYSFYKPFQVLSQFSAVEGKQTLADFLTLPSDVYPVGRLDYDSEGLLLLTNDTRLNFQLLHPSNAHKRSYLVQVEGAISPSDLIPLQKGLKISIDGKPHQCLPVAAEILLAEPDVPERNPPIRFRKNIPTSWLSLTLIEGKNRQVRRMTAAIGFPTLRLLRWSMENLDIAGMQPGDLKQLTFSEIQRLLR